MLQYVLLHLGPLLLGHALVEDHVEGPCWVLLGEVPWVVTVHLCQLP